MRDVEFTVKEDAWDNDDIQYAFGNNSLGERLKDIESIVAEVAGENDGYDWHWILKMKDGTFSYATVGCDYTGWDCQSNASIADGFKTPEDAINIIEISEFDSRKKIKECLLGQIKGTIPFAIYQENIGD